MKDKKQLQADMDQLDIMHNLVTVFQELAASQVRHTRDTILANRPFIEGLSEVHHIIQLASPVSDEKPKRAAIFISAHARLHGDVIFKSFGLFREFVKQYPDTITFVFGALGKQLAEQAQIKVNFYHDLKDQEARFADVAPLIYKLFDFDILHVFHGKFFSLGRQDPVNVALLEVDRKDSAAVAKARDYLFEPSQEQLENVFRHELMVAMLAQQLRESHLAKQGSRFQQLDSAIQKIGDVQTKTKGMMLQLRKDEERRQQSTRLSRLMAMKRRSR